FVPFHYPEAAANVLTHTVLDPEAKIPELKGGGVALAKAALTEAEAKKEVVTVKGRATAPPPGQVAAARRRVGRSVQAYAPDRPGPGG
ncbi:MAG: hypothetical protein H5T97_07065, partial [Firmicutes bacterium]|nr:hypothetical protein [Bacillota bacterium]